jgi:hypothetical protein
VTFAAVFAAAWMISGFHGAPPAVTVDPSLAVYAEARPALVAVSSELYADATGDQQQRVNAAAALIPEFAHERQTPGMSGWLQESGAEAFSRDKDSALRQRFGVLPERWAYASGAQSVWMFGAWWVRRGQFA